MTIQYLYDHLKKLLKQMPEYKDYNIVVCDDGMESKFFDIDNVITLQISRMTKPAQIKEKVEEIQEDISDQLYGNYHWEDKNGNSCPAGMGHIVSNGPVYKTVKKIVPVQIKPPKYKLEKVIALITNLTNTI